MAQTEGGKNAALHGSVNSAMLGVVGDDSDQKKGGGGKGRGFKRVKRSQENNEKVEGGANLEKKRPQEEEEDMDVDGLDRPSNFSKLVEETSVTELKNAGLADRSSGNQ